MLFTILSINKYVSVCFALRLASAQHTHTMHKITNCIGSDPRWFRAFIVHISQKNNKVFTNTCSCDKLLSSQMNTDCINLRCTMSFDKNDLNFTRHLFVKLRFSE